jgi:creatinine amidohydrolase/Fe(II)-dependent formamide hydrolase-like protein
MMLPHPIRIAIAERWPVVLPLMTPEATAGFPFDHPGQGETSLMMALCPAGVDLAKLSDKQWRSRSAAMPRSRSAPRAGIASSPACASFSGPERALRGKSSRCAARKKVSRRFFSGLRRFVFGLRQLD